MLRIRTLGLALVAVFALSAIASSAASAELPEFKAPFPKKFTQTGEGWVIVRNLEGYILICRNSKDEGEITGAMRGSMTMRFNTCEGVGDTECQTAGANMGEIVTSALDMQVGYINKTKKEVGVAFTGTGGTGKELFAEVTCNDGGSPIPLLMKYGPIGLITPVNTATDAFKISFPETLIKKLQKGEEHTLWVSINGGPYHQGVTMETNVNILTEGLTEIIA